MRRHLFIVSICLLLPVIAIASSADVQLLRQARAQIRVIAGELQLKVSRDLEAKGAENALGSCRLKVEGITDRLTSHSGWEIRRTAYRVRNPDNRPDPWEKQVLDLFRQRQADGFDLEKFEFAKVVNHDGKRAFRYIQPILMQDSCTNCHGNDISPAVQDALRAEYPDDAATGFRPGELRGAYSLLKVLPGDPP